MITFEIEFLLLLLYEVERLIFFVSLREFSSLNLFHSNSRDY